MFALLWRVRGLRVRLCTETQGVLPMAERDTHQHSRRSSGAIIPTECAYTHGAPDGSGSPRHPCGIRPSCYFSAKINRTILGHYS